MNRGRRRGGAGSKGGREREARREGKTEGVTSKTRWGKGDWSGSVGGEETRGCVHAPSVL